MLQPEAAAEGRCDEEQSQQAASGAAKRGVGHFGQPLALRAEHPVQAGSSLDSPPLRQLPPHQKLLSRCVIAYVSVINIFDK